MAAKRTIYRDKKTGRFVKKAKWERSKTDRYVRQRIKIGKKREREREIEPTEEPETGDIFEFLVSFSYDKTGRSFDIIVTATNAEEAKQVARQFLRSDSKGQNITRAKFSGWSQRIARGDVSTGDAGEAEYRSPEEE